jgi:hypothetical protein
LSELPPARTPLAPLYLFVPGLVFRDHRLSWAAKFTYGLLASVADHEGKCYPSVQRVATSFDPPISKRYAVSLLTELVDAGWVRREIRQTSEDPRATNWWWLTGPLPMRAGVSKPATGGTNDQGGGDQHDRGAPDETISLRIENTKDSSHPKEPGKSSTFSPQFSTGIEEALRPYLAAARHPDSIRQVVQRALAPIAHGNAATPEQIVGALVDMQANNVSPFSAAAFAAYVLRRQRGDQPPPDAGAAGTSTPKPPTPPRGGARVPMADRLRQEREQGKA